MMKRFYFPMAAAVMIYSVTLYGHHSFTAIKIVISQRLQLKMHLTLCHMGRELTVFRAVFKI